MFTIMMMSLKRLTTYIFQILIKIPDGKATSNDDNEHHFILIFWRHSSLFLFSKNILCNTARLANTAPVTFHGIDEMSLGNPARVKMYN
jgi:hypothetical protein